jgi:hypothetical protein
MAAPNEPPLDSDLTPDDESVLRSVITTAFDLRRLHYGWRFMVENTDRLPDHWISSLIKLRGPTAGKADGCDGACGGHLFR